MPGHLQHEPLGLVLRDRDLSWHGLPRLLPGPARRRATRAGARQGAHPRPRRDPVRQRRRLPPVPAAHEDRQRRDRLRLQRRPALARPRRRRLPQGDRRHHGPRRARQVQRRGRSHPLRPPGAVRPVHPRPDRPARPAAHRPGRLERLPEPQLLLGNPRRVFPDHGEPARRRRRVGVHRRPLHARRQGACGHRGVHRPERRGGGLPGRRGEDGRRDRRARLGRRVVPARLRPLR